MATANLSSRLTMDDSNFNRKARRAADTAKNASDKMRASFAGAAKSFAGIFAGAMTMRGLKSLGAEFDRIGKLATRLRQTPEDIQKLGFVASQTGSDLERIAKALDMADRKMGDLKNNKLTEAAANSLRIDIDAFKAQDAIGRIAMLAEAFNNANDKSKASADLFQIVGRNASEMKPLLDLGAEGVRNLAGEIDVLSTEGVRRIEQLNDKWDKFVKSTKVKMAESILGLTGNAGNTPDVKMKGGFFFGANIGNPELSLGAFDQERIDRQRKEYFDRIQKRSRTPWELGDEGRERLEAKGRLRNAALDRFAMMMGVAGTIGVGGGDRATLTRKIRNDAGQEFKPIKIEFPRDSFSSAMSTGRMAGGMAELNAAIASGGNAARSPVLEELKKLNRQQENLEKSWDAIARILTLGIVGG